MLELDFSNADTVSEDKLIYIKSIKDSSNIKVDSSAIILNDIYTNEDIKANYSLVIFGDITANRIDVLKDILCFGNIKCNSLNVNGNLKCFKDITVGDMHIGNDAFINSGIIKEDSSIEGNLLVGQTIEVVRNLSVSQNVICNEGIVGSGKTICNNIVAIDFMEVNQDVKGKNILLESYKPEKESEKSEDKYVNVLSDEKKVDALSLRIEQLYDKSKTITDNKALEISTIIKDSELLDLLIKVKSINRFIKEAFEDFISTSESSMEFEKISDVIRASTRYSNSFKEHHNIYKSILEWSERKPERNIASFLKFVDMKRRSPGYLLKISICEDFFDTFVEHEKAFIEEMNTGGISDQQQFVYNLTLLEQNKGQFTEEEYMMILDKLYAVIGVKSNMVKKFISIGG